ncbi:UbiD family decarboxylase [Marininema halotolerans]|uniref:UbiD family decarboxylase n=1 Tax=Marininema halotolerans TaxID=1155944 RepID=A0A1I6SUQ3_9BACL|nr:UbiD family decarboxylase [Marininema halotolerans]SFS80695.1 UbiD family decarboxylase [Marininema halotolerans]
MITNIRQLLQHWREQQILQRVTKPVDPEFELGAVVKQFQGKTPLLFEKILGYSVPVAVGLGGDRTRVAESMGILPDAIISRLMDAITHPIPTQRIEQGPVQENVILEPEELDSDFPVCRYHEEDCGHYYVSGLLVVKGRDGVKRYTSIRRMKFLGGNRTNIVITSPGLQEQYRQLEERGEPMEIAVMFGVIPAVVLASQVSTHLYDTDKLDVAGALIGEGLKVVSCRTVDLDVLAEAEVVFEGKVLPKAREYEGVFAELGGYYGGESDQPIVEITAITHRNQPIWQTILPASCEEKLPMALTREATLFATVRQVVPTIRDVHITMPGAGRFHGIIQIEKQREGDAKQAMLAAFAGDKDLKHVVVVDRDVNIWDPEEVEWAIATRFQADHDLMIIPGANGSPLEPSHELRGVSAKMGMDATYPLGQEKMFRRAKIPGMESIDLRNYVE